MYGGMVGGGSSSHHGRKKKRPAQTTQEENQPKSFYERVAQVFRRTVAGVKGQRGESKF